MEAVGGVQAAANVIVLFVVKERTLGVCASTTAVRPPADNVSGWSSDFDETRLEMASRAAWRRTASSNSSSSST